MRGKTQKPHNFLYSIILFVLFIYAVPSLAASEPGEESEAETSFIMHHVQDSHQWHFATVGHTELTIWLPVILYASDRGFEMFSSKNFYNETHEKVAYKGYALNEHDHIESVERSSKVYDFSVTKNVASLFFSMALLLIIFVSIANRYKKAPKLAPKGIQSFFEPIIMFVRDEIAIPNIGIKKYRRYMPYLLTLFFFIWFNNILGLLPGAANLTGNIAVTMILAVITFLYTNLSGNKDYWRHIFATPGIPKAILPILVPVEILGLFTKPFSLMIRLFVSITAGHIVILSLIGLAFIFNSYLVGIGSTIFVVFIGVIELLVATIQAYIFTLFSSMYIGAAVAEHHHGEAVDESLI